jgi:hypothetical protein
VFVRGTSTTVKKYEIVDQGNRPLNSEFFQTIDVTEIKDVYTEVKKKSISIYSSRGTKTFVLLLLEVSDKGIRGVGGVAGKEAKTVQTINIISQRQYFVVRCLR